MSKYEAIVFDLDGTAVPNLPGGMPSPRLVETIKRHKPTTYLIAATGRPVRHAYPILDALQLLTPAIVSGGTIILAPKTHEVLKFTPLPAKAIHALFQVIQDRPYTFSLRDEVIETRGHTLHPKLVENIEIVYIGSVPAGDVAQLKSDLALIADIAASFVPDWLSTGFAINIVHKDATKEHAVAEVLSLLGVKPEATIGIGDGANDLHLFRSVGLKVAMGNAAPELKSAADIIAPSVEEDGLAIIIERYAGRE